MYCAMAFDFSCQRGVWCSIRTSKRTQRGGMCFGAMLTRVAAPRTHESIECIGVNELKMIQVPNPLLNFTHTRTTVDQHYDRQHSVRSVEQRVGNGWRSTKEISANVFISNKSRGGHGDPCDRACSFVCWSPLHQSWSPNKRSVAFDLGTLRVHFGTARAELDGAFRQGSCICET